MSRRTDAGAVARLLGPEAAAGGPLVLLGLDSALADPERVIAARDARIAQIDRHPLRETPDADEVRLAVHAAAANLLDPRVRGVLGAGAPAGGIPATPHRLEEDALLAMGMHGGLNRKALRHLSIVAHARGLGAQEIARAILALARGPSVRRGTPPKVEQPGHARAPTTTPEPEPIDDTWRIAALIGGSVLAGAAMLGIAALVFVRAAMAPSAPSRSAEVASPLDRGSAVLNEPAPVLPAPRDRLDAPGVIAHELRSSASAYAQDPAVGLERFERAIEALGEVWALSDPSEVAHANVAAVEFVRVAQGRGVEAITALASADPDTRRGVASAVWAAGMLGAIHADARAAPEISVQASESLHRLGLSPSPGREAAALAALHALVSSLDLRDASVWTAWADALAATAPRPSAAYNTAMLSGFSRVLRDPHDPSPEVIDLLVDRTDWRAGSPSRVWLINAFQAVDTPTERLAMLVDALVSRSAAAGVSADMAMPRDASPAQRADAAARFAGAWNVRAREVPDELTRSVLEDLSRSAERVRSGSVRGAPLVALADLSRACAAAEMLLNGHATAAGEVLASTRDIVQEVSGQPARAHDPLEASGRDGVWGAAVLDAATPRATLEAVRAGVPEPVGPADARVLAREAFRGTPMDVRQAAAERAIGAAGSAHLTLAVLALVEEIPRTEQSARTIEAITGRPLVYDETAEFPAAARAALLARALEQLAEQTDEARRDRAARLIDEHYALALASSSAPTAWGPAHESAAALRRRWATGPGLLGALPAGQDGAIEARRAATWPLARGPIARLVVEQQAMVETMGAVLQAARPHQADRIRGTLAAYALADGQSRDAFGQLVAGALARAGLLGIALEDLP